MHKDTTQYNRKLDPGSRAIAELLAAEIERALPEAENRIWHAHPVWFLAGNPIVGYSRQKDCVRLMFWSGRSFDEEGLEGDSKFKDASARYTDADEVKVRALRRWLKKSREIQWDYKNIVKRRGKLVRIR